MYKKSFLILLATILASNLLLANPSVAQTPLPICQAVTSTNSGASSLVNLPQTLSTFPEIITINTNCGPIDIQLFGPSAPLNISNLLSLARIGYYNMNVCHRVTTQGLFVIQCGDPAESGRLPLPYKIKDENLPTPNSNFYPEGTIGLANAGANTNGSQFFFTYKDSPIPPYYPVIAKVLSGMEILKYLGSKGSKVGSDGPMNFPLQILSITERDRNYSDGFLKGISASTVTLGEAHKIELDKISQEFQEEKARNTTLNSITRTLLEDKESLANANSGLITQSSAKMKKIATLQSKIKKICAYRPTPKGC